MVKKKCVQLNSDRLGTIQTSNYPNAVNVGMSEDRQILLKAGKTSGKQLSINAKEGYISLSKVQPRQVAQKSPSTLSPRTPPATA